MLTAKTQKLCIMTKIIVLTNLTISHMHFPVTATSMYHEHDGPKQSYKFRCPKIVTLKSKVFKYAK